MLVAAPAADDVPVAAAAGKLGAASGARAGKGGAGLQLAVRCQLHAAC